MATILDKYIRMAQTPAVGGTGGGPFTLQSRSPASPLRTLQVNTSGKPGTGNNYVTYIKATFADGSEGTAGKGANTFPNTFTFEDDEVIQEFFVYFIDYQLGRVAVSFTTSMGRSFAAGDTGKPRTQMAIAGGRIFGFVGNAATDVDKIGLFTEIPVTALEIYDVKYTTGTTPTVLGPVALDTITLSNNSSSETQNASITRSYSTTNTSSWSITGGLKIGIKTTISTGIPWVVEGKVEVSGEISFAYTYGRAHASTQTFQYTAQVSVPKNTQVTAQVTATQGSLTVKYTAVMDIWYADGVSATVDLDGTYSGITSYNIVVSYSSPKSPEAIIEERIRQITAAEAVGQRDRTRPVAALAS